MAFSLRHVSKQEPKSERSKSLKISMRSSVGRSKMCGISIPQKQCSLECVLLYIGSNGLQAERLCCIWDGQDGSEEMYQRSFAVAIPNISTMFSCNYTHPAISIHPGALCIFSGYVLLYCPHFAFLFPISVLP